MPPVESAIHKDARRFGSAADKVVNYNSTPSLLSDLTAVQLWRSRKELSVCQPDEKRDCQREGVFDGPKGVGLYRSRDNALPSTSKTVQL